MEKIRNIILLLTAMSLNALAQIAYVNVEIPDAKPVADNSKSSKKYAKSTKPKVSIGNHVWFDHNENGVQDLGELGVYGVDIKLYNNADCTGSVVATTQSSDVGYYKFSDILESTDKYCIGVEYPAHWTHTLAHKGDGLLDSDVTAMNDSMGKIENIQLTKSSMSLDIGLRHKDKSCQVPTLKVNARGTYDNRNSWAKRSSLDVEFENVVASGFCHEYTNNGPERGEEFSVHLKDRLGFSDIQRDRLSRIFRFMGDPEISQLVEDTFNPNDRAYWFNIVSNSFVWYYSDWKSDFSKIEEYIDKSSWSTNLSADERDSLKSISRLIVNKIEGLNGETQYEPMKVYYLWDEDNDKHQDIIVPETSVVPKLSECTAPIATAELGNFVWFDADRNGKQDNGEAGLKDVKVELYSNDTLLKSITTDANGAYGFSALEAGEYSLKFFAKSGWSITTQNADGVSDKLNSDADKTTGKTVAYTLNDGDKNFNIDVGMYITPKPAIKITKETNGGKVDNIVEGDIITWTYVVSNTGNAPLSNLLITDNKEGAVSDCKGDGSLERLNPTKSITCTKVGTAILGAYTNSVTVNASADEVDVHDSASSSYVGKDAPVLTGSVGDYVWLDSNHNGIQDANELPLSSIVVKLFNSNGKVKATTKTDASGKYHFADVVAGKYYIEFTLPSGYTVTTQDKGDDSLDSDANTKGITSTFTLSAGEDKDSIDMGLYPMLVELGNRVWYDANRNGIQDADEKKSVSNVTVKLYKEGGEFVKETKTRASGYYAFKNLIAGNYYVVFEAPANYKVSPQNVGSNDSDDSDANPTTGKTDIIKLIAGVDNRTVDMGLYQEASKVGDRVWYDANKNGLQDAGENGVADVTVKLYFVGDSEPTETTKTSANGIYLFDNVAPADYYIVFTAPAAYTITEANKGDDRKDSDADKSGRTDNFTLLAGTQNSTIDMGVYQNVVSLGDKVWLDSNHDGLQDVGETGVRDVKVTIHSETNDFAKTVRTDENGNYLFTHLSAGEYSVEFEDVPYGHLVTQKDVNSNANDLNDSDVFVNADEKLVTEGTLLTPGENDLSWDMGIYKTVCLPGKAVLGNLVWEDFNKNGIQDIGERGVANVKAVLFNNDTDEKVGETITDENGLYEFAHLDPEFNYYVQFIVPAGYVVSPQDQDDDVIDSDTDATGKTDVITLTADQINSTVDMGIHHEGSTLGDRVWYDEKGGVSNGLQDEGENGVQDVKVTLYAANGDEVKITQTNASGEYHFTNIPKGDYTVGFSELPDGYVFSIKDQGANEEADSDVNANGRTDMITINGVHNLTHIDAGIKTIRTGDAGSDIEQGISGKNVVIDVLANDNEGTYEFDASTVKIASTPDGATLSEDGKTLTVPAEGVWSVDPVTGAITFTPNDGFVGDPTPISYTVSDTQGNESGAEVEVNYPPVAQNDFVNGEVGKQIVVYVLDNDSNTSTPLDKSTVRIINPENGDEVESITVVGEGTWSTNSDGSITFTPEYGFELNPTPIEYTVKEQSGDVSNRATVTIVYPDAVDDVLIVPVGHNGDITVNVVENDSNNTEASLISLGCAEANVKSLTINGEGVWSVADSGTVTFAPAEGFVNEPSDINYSVGLVSGERSNCATIDVRFELLTRDDSSLINVGSVTLIPILNNDYGSLNPESVLLILPENIPAGSRVSEDGKTLTVRGEGVWSVNSVGVVSFRPEEGFTAIPTPINYSVENSNGLVSNISTITLTQGGDTTIVATNNTGEANAGNPIVIDVLSDDRGDLNGSTVYILDADGNRVDSRIVAGEGSWQVNDDQTVTFTPEEGYTGTPTPIEYVIQDRHGAISNAATITIAGVCTCKTYEESISVMSDTAGILMLLLTLLLTVFFFEREENMRYS
jgi:CshA-type fibril repeat protein